MKKHPVTLGAVESPGHRCAHIVPQPPSPTPEHTGPPQHTQTEATLIKTHLRG